MDTDKNVVKKVTRLMVALFTLGPILGIVSATLYGWYIKSTGAWEPSTSLFHVMILFFALSTTAPALGLTMRMMFISLVLGLKGIENTNKVGPVMDRIEMLLTKIEPVLERTLHGDTLVKVERVFASADELISSGSLERIEGHLEKMADFADPKERDPIVPILTQRQNSCKLRSDD